MLRVGPPSQVGMTRYNESFADITELEASCNVERATIYANVWQEYPDGIYPMESTQMSGVGIVGTMWKVLRNTY